MHLHDDASSFKRREQKQISLKGIIVGHDSNTAERGNLSGVKWASLCMFVKVVTEASTPI